MMGQVSTTGRGGVRASIVIPTWNGAHLLRQCLLALESLETLPGGYEVIVVDNGSTDGTELVLRREFPQVRFVRSEVNRGFAGGCNLGLRAAGGEYLILLNNDTLPNPDWLRSLVDCADASAAGAVSSKLLYLRDGDIINNAGSSLDPESDWPIKDRGINEIDEGQYDATDPPTAFCGAAVLLKRSMLEEIGLFDERFFMYWEDGDLSWRASSAGWKTAFAPDAIVRHVHAASSGEGSSFFRYYANRNRVLILAKHGAPAIALRALSKVTAVFVRAASQAAIRGPGGPRLRATRATNEIRTLLRLLLSLASNFPHVLALRMGLRREMPLTPHLQGPTVASLHSDNGHVEPTQLRVAIYNPYLGAMGGGERLTVAMAEALSREHKVEILADKHFGSPSIPQLEEYFGVALPGVKVIDLETLGSHSVAKLPWPFSNIQLASDFRSYRDLRLANYDIFINNQYWSSMPCPSPAGIYLCMFPRLKETASRDDHSLLRNLYRRMIGAAEELLFRRPDKAMLTYSSILSISEFTNDWLRSWWALSGHIVHPPCGDRYVPGIEKRKMILSTGRFFAPSGDNHHKRHDALIEAFSFLSRRHPDWELHLAGSRANDKLSAHYVERLQDEAAAMNVHFHFDVSYDELTSLYNQASFYWHATGFGRNSDAHPERQEHFGITTVEAMTAGAVPIIYPSGGQREIVIDGVNGRHWTSLRELVERTSALIDDEHARRLMSLTAKDMAARYGTQVFAKKFLELFDHAANEPESCRADQVVPSTQSPDVAGRPPHRNGE